jgi:hypothetical protein
MKKVSKVLTSRGRKQIAKKHFALPGGRYPIHDISHARNALSRAPQHASPGEAAIIRKKVYAKYPSLEKNKEATMKTHLTKKAAKSDPIDHATKDQIAKALKAAAQLGDKTVRSKVKKAKATFSPAMDKSPLLKGKQSELPDQIQSRILKRLKNSPKVKKGPVRKPGASIMGAPADKKEKSASAGYALFLKEASKLELAKRTVMRKLRGAKETTKKALTATKDSASSAGKSYLDLLKGTRLQAGRNLETNLKGALEAAKNKKVGWFSRLTGGQGRKNKRVEALQAALTKTQDGVRNEAIKTYGTRGATLLAGGAIATKATK